MSCGVYSSWKNTDPGTGDRTQVRREQGSRSACGRRQHAPWLRAGVRSGGRRRRSPQRRSSTSHQGSRGNAPTRCGCRSRRTQAALAGEHGASHRLPADRDRQRPGVTSVRRSRAACSVSVDTEQAPCPPSGDAHGPCTVRAGGRALGSPSQQAGASPQLPAAAPGDSPSASRTSPSLVNHPTHASGSSAQCL